MSGFPLYDSLIKTAKNKDLNAKYKLELIKKLNNFDDNEKELVYVLIQFYYMQNEKNMTDTIPYNCKVVEKDGLSSLSWSFNDFPNKLKNLLSIFIEMHIKTKDDEVNVRK